MGFKSFCKTILGRQKLKEQGIESFVLIMVDGGLGSQLNKFMIGESIRKKNNVKVKYDLSWFESHGKSTDGKHNRNFELTKVFPNIHFDIATKEEADFYKKWFRYENQEVFKFNPKFTRLKPPFFLDGYLSHWKYLKNFQDLGLNHFDFNLQLSEKNFCVLEDIKSQKNSVAVHIRRGDYLNSVHDVLGAKYFIEAIKYMQERLKNDGVKFYIFSNGMDWVKEEVVSKLDENIDIFLVEENDNDSGAVDFYLLAQCKNQIISNASFGFFGAFLNQNPNKIVIMPKIWMLKQSNSGIIDKESEKAHRYPGWVVMSKDGEVIND